MSNDDLQQLLREKDSVIPQILDGKIDASLVDLQNSRQSDMHKGLKIDDLTSKLGKLPYSQKAIVSKSGKGLYLLEYVSRADEPYVLLKIAPEDRTYGIIHVDKETRGFFPGYRKQFVLETDVKPFIMHLTGAPNGSEVGDEVGGYVCHPKTSEIEARLLDNAPDARHSVEGSFKRWYDAHPEVNPGRYVKVFRTHPELFRLEL